MNGNILSNALESAAKFVYLNLYHLTSDYGISLVFLSLVSSALMILLMRAIRILPERESTVQRILSPQLAKIKSECRGEERHRRISELYRKYAYHPILGLRSAIPVLIQLPFLFAAYIMLSNLSELNGIGFLFVRNLGAPDALLGGFNILPFIMTLVNITTAFITVSFSFREKAQACVIALFFLVLLYGAPSALLVFWTMNNITLLIRTLAKQILRGEHVVSLAGIFPGKRADGKESAEILNQEKVFAVLIPFCAMLSLFYLYQAAAAYSTFIFSRGVKPFHYLLSSSGLTILLMMKSRIGFLTFRVKIAVISLTALLLVFSGLWERDFFGTAGEFISVFSLSCLLGFLYTAIALALALTGRKRNMHTEFFNAGKRYIIGFVVTMVPALYVASNNSDYIYGTYYGYYILVMVVFSVFNYLWLVIFSGNLPSRSRTALYAAFFSFLFALLPVTRSIFAMTSRNDLIFFILFFAALLLAVFAERQLTFNRLVLFSVCFSLVSVYSIISKNINYNLYNSKKTAELPPQLKSIDFKSTPNIYLFVFDGMPNRHVLRYLNVSTNRLTELLDTHDFTLYDNTYSLGQPSLYSMSATLNCTANRFNMDQARDIYSGNSLVNLTLRSKGYKTYSLLVDYLSGPYAVFNQDLVYETYPAVKKELIHLNFFATLIRGFFQGEFSCNTKGIKMRGSYTEENMQIKKVEIIKNGEKKKFVVNHFKFPHHAQNSGKCLPDETEIWMKKLNVALNQMEKDFSAIKKYDPDSIAIVIGDHGPYLSGDCAELRNWNKKDITADMIWTRAGTMIAIRWPDARKARKYDRDFVLNQDIFPIVFSYLSDNEEYLKMKPDRTMHGYGIKFREGRIIE